MHVVVDACVQNIYWVAVHTRSQMATTWENCAAQVPSLLCHFLHKRMSVHGVYSKTASVASAMRFISEVMYDCAAVISGCAFMTPRCVANICVLSFLVQINNPHPQQLPIPGTVKSSSRKCYGLNCKNQCECLLAFGVRGCCQHPSFKHLCIDLIDLRRLLRTSTLRVTLPINFYSSLNLDHWQLG